MPGYKHIALPIKVRLQGEVIRSNTWCHLCNPFSYTLHYPRPLMAQYHGELGSRIPGPTLPHRVVRVTHPICNHLCQQYVIMLLKLYVKRMCDRNCRGIVLIIANPIFLTFYSCHFKRIVNS